MLRQIKTLHLQRCNQMMLKSQPYSSREGTQPLVAAVLWEPGEATLPGHCAWAPRSSWMVLGSSSLWSLQCPNLSRTASSWCLPRLLVLSSLLSIGTPRMCPQASCGSQSVGDWSWCEELHAEKLLPILQLLVHFLTLCFYFTISPVTLGWSKCGW